MIATEEELARFEKLSPQLKKIAAFLALGHNCREISSRLSTSYETVRKQQQILRYKTDFDTSLRLAVYIVRHPQIESMLREFL